MTADQQQPAFDQHCIVELLGHRRLAGRVREVQLAGAGFLRLDIPPTPGHAGQTQYVAPGSVYALHPTSEAIALAVAARCRPEPVQRWELPAAPAAAVHNPDDPHDEPDEATIGDLYDGLHDDDEDLDDVHGGGRG